VFIFPSISVDVPTPSKVMHPQNITATRGPLLKPNNLLWLPMPEGRGHRASKPQSLNKKGHK
jgi:hypothetical protein